MTTCIKLIAQFDSFYKLYVDKTAKTADFLISPDAGTPLANWLKRDQWALVSSNERVRK